MDRQSTTAASRPAEIDILQHVSVSVPCPACGQHYDVPLRQVLLSQQMLHEGCPVATETECPQVTYAVLVNEAILADFQRSWARLVAQVRHSGFDVTVARPLLSH